MATRIRRTLYIGLGGTGMNAILHAKKLIYDTFGEIPPMIGFLGIDTDGGVYNKTLTARDGTAISLKVSEQLPITVDAPALIYSNSPSNYDWMPDCNIGSLSALSLGAGQIRSNGRFAITMHEEDVADRIMGAIRSINNATIINNTDYALLSDATEVHVVFSLSGGTGAGTFLNIAYLLQRVLQNENAKISGYAVMGDIFRAMSQGSGMRRVRANALGSLIDVDFLTHLDPKSEPVEIKWLNTVQRVNTRPFTAMYLIDNKNAGNDVFTDIDSLCEMISLALVTSAGELSVAAASTSDNIAKDIADGVMDIARKKAWAAGFGVSEIVYDAASLRRIYACKAAQQLLAHLTNGGCDDPSNIANAWIDNERIRENQGKDDVIDFFMRPAPKYLLEEVDQASPKGDVQQYLSGAAKEPAAELDNKLAELKARIGASLTDLINKQLNRPCGVYLTEHILHAVQKQVALCDNEMEQEIKEKEELLVRQKAGLGSTIKELEECTGFFKRGQRKELAAQVCDEAVQQATTEREPQRRRYARMFYRWLTTEVGDRFDLINKIISNLRTLQTQYTDTIATVAQNIGRGSFFQEDLATAEVNSVDCTPDEVAVTNFINKLGATGGVQAFATMPLQQIDDFVRAYVYDLPKAKAYAAANIDDVLAALSPEALEGVCKRAIRKAMPLFPYHYHGFDAQRRAQPSDYYYVGVNDHKHSILRTADYFKELIPGRSNVAFASTGAKDRVIIYHQVGVVPLFCLSAVDGYRTEYDQIGENKEHTSHWDAQMCRRMQRERYGILPKDEVDRKEAMEMWLTALMFGIMDFDPAKDCYTIRSRALGGAAMRGFRVEAGHSRKEAFDFFMDNIDALKPELARELSDLNRPGPDNPAVRVPEQVKASATDGSYYSAFSRCPIAVEHLESYPDDFELINKEIEYIIDNF